MSADRTSISPIMQVGPVFLEHMKIDSFGTFANKAVGPFTPKLNVVFGKNESGKTTLNAFFGGILFGWEENRGSRNTYKPKNAERAGSLLFVDSGTGEELVLSRVKNSDGLQGQAALLEDIDKETYLTMFALTSDELRSLRNTTDVTAKLLTAGSGTSASPAYALGELQRMLAEHSSRAAGMGHSLAALEGQRAQTKALLADAAEEAELFKHQEKEFRELAPQRAEMTRKLQTINAEIELLAAQKASLEKLDAQHAKYLGQRRGLVEDGKALEAELQQHRQDAPPEMALLEASDEYLMRERIDKLLDEQRKCEHGIQLAKDNYAESKASYEALLEADDLKELEKRAKRQHTIRIVLSTVLPLAFMVAGIPIFMRGREINSLSFTALGICLVFFAILLAGAALVVLTRPSKTDEELKQRKKDKKWVMLQDKKKLEACESELREQEKRARAVLDELGLASACGSLGRARSLLDEARDMRAEAGLLAQKQQALVAQLTSVDEALEDIEEQRAKAFGQLSLKPDTTPARIEELVSQKTLQRSTLIETSEKVNRRYGELKSELSRARQVRRLDELKLEYQQIRTRQRESAQDYARLLLAKRSLEAAISAWESKSQPEVYKQASRLLSLMTDGAWVQVRMSQEGRLQVVDGVKTEREPTHLSLGTCQQLYLSLRIALLMTAENVGRAIPIMADDILVNFDAARRVGAVSALLELAERRQVILFTCHEEIVQLIRSADPHTNVIEL